MLTGGQRTGNMILGMRGAAASHPAISRVIRLALLIWICLSALPRCGRADEPLILTMGAPKEFELPYPISDVFQVDLKMITVDYAKKTALLRIEGRSIGDTSVLVLDTFGNYHTTPVKVVGNSTLAAYQWLKQNFASVPGLSITVESNRAKASGEIFSQRVRQRLLDESHSIGFVSSVRLHPYVYQVLKLPPEPEPEPPPPPPPRPKGPTESKFQLSEFWTSVTYPGGVPDDIEDLPFSSYLTRMRDKIAARWRDILAGGAARAGARSVGVRYQIQRNGRVSYAIIERPSGSEMFDRAALEAIDKASPLESLPDSLDGSTLTVHYKFTYRGGGARASDD